MRISEFKDRYEGLLSQSAALKREDVFTSCGERKRVGVIFVLSGFVVGGRVKKPQRALGVGFKMPAQCCKIAGPPHRL